LSLLIKPLVCDWVFVDLFGALGVVDASIRVNPDELVAENSVARLA